jgi:hypothetical protein
MDDISQVAYSNRHGTRLEEEIIRNFDYTLCTSKELTRLKSAFSKKCLFPSERGRYGNFKKGSNLKFYPGQKN